MEVESRHIPDELGMDSLSSFLASPQRIDCEASSPLAIHVYSRLAKLHKHTLIPYLPRIMSCVLSSLSSSLQLHPACMQVVSALATHTIDSSRDPASNEDTLRSLCCPLLSALSSPHPPHLSAGAASCLQSLVESDRWTCAPLDLQELVCAKGMQALMDEGIQMVAHMDLMRSLAMLSSGVVIQGYGVPLLAAGMNILQNSCSTSKRVAAAQILESVLKIADAELLDLDISPIVGVLQECQQDKIAGVRTAVADALKTANSYASCDNACDKVHVPIGIEKTTHQGFLGLAHKAHRNSHSPAAEYPTMQVAGLPIGGAPCHGTLFTSTPSSNKSDKWLRCLPLAPLQQSSMVNSTLVAPIRRQPAASKLSEYKENVAPAYNSRAPASRDLPRRAWTPKRDSPLLWPQSTLRKTHVEKWSLFDSPHTPIVPFRGEAEAGEQDTSVNTLLEKHFGKQKYFFEDEVDGSLGNIASNMARFSRNEVSYQEKGQCNDGEVYNSFDQESGGRSSTGSLGTDMCCGTEEIYSPNKESASDCESSITSVQGSNLPQVMVNQSLSVDLTMTPRRLVRTLQFDDEYETNLDQDKRMESDEATPVDGSRIMCASTESEEDRCYGNSKIGATFTENNSSSESYTLFCEGETRVNMNLDDTISSLSSSLKRRVRSDAFPLMEKMGTSGFMYSGETCFEEDKAIQHHNEAPSRRPVTCDEYEKINGDWRLSHDTRGQSTMSDLQLKAIRTQQNTQINLCFRLWGKAHYIFLVVICVGLFFTGFATYMANVEASNVLVPT